MARRRRNDSWRGLPHRTFACVALVGYLATAIGFPLPRLSNKDHRQPFPCQDHPCGCQTAEECWRHCCCFSPEERFAWAESHHINPPAYAERPAAKGWQTVRVRDGAACTHCGEGCAPACSPWETGRQVRTPQGEQAGAHACCSNRQSEAPCCSKHSGRPADGARPKSPSRGSWFLGMAAMGCQGTTSLWVSVGAVLPPPIPLAWSESLLPSDWLCPWNASPLSVNVPPPDPPPRMSWA